MEIAYRDIGEHKVIQVSGEVDLYNVSELKRALFGITDGKHSSVVVDMRNVNYMDSSGIGAHDSRHQPAVGVFAPEASPVTKRA
jgi:anti-sigma B factor antagonist